MLEFLQQKISRRKLIMNNFRNGFVAASVLEGGGHFSHSNCVMSEILGYTRGDLHGRTLEEIIYPDDLKEYHAQHSMLLQKRRCMLSMDECRFFHKNGNLLSARLVILRIKHSSEKFIMVINEAKEIQQSENVE